VYEHTRFFYQKKKNYIDKLGTKKYPFRHEEGKYARTLIYKKSSESWNFLRDKILPSISFEFHCWQAIRAIFIGQPRLKKINLDANINSHFSPHPQLPLINSFQF